MSNKFESGAVAPAGSVPQYWFLFKGSNLLLRKGEDGLSLPFCYGEQPDGITFLRRDYIGRIGTDTCIAAELPDSFTVPDDMELTHLRQAFRHLDEELFWAAGRAVQILEWDRTHQYCGRCGIPTTRKDTEHARICPQCNLHFYPRLSPAVIMAVTKGDDVLMARNSRWPEGHYSVLAGFVEAGETLEQTVAREVFEEVGIHVKNIRYFGSQPWAFPSSMMMGFLADYESGELSPDYTELSDAQWFGIDEMPPVAPKGTIARALIEQTLKDIDSNYLINR